MQIISTSDGSHTLFSEQFNEIYHSRHGAIQESKHVFIKHGFEFCVKDDLKELRIFEMGFGTGLNALLTLIETQKYGIKVYYETVELYPVPPETIKELNYTQLLENEKSRPAFHSMHLSTWNETHQITPDFAFKKRNDSILTCNLPPIAIGAANQQLIYYDAFAPSHQPELWTAEVMSKMYNCLIPKGILVSYCSKSSFRRALNEVGFKVEKLPGPPGKREMVRAQRE